MTEGMQQKEGTKRKQTLIPPILYTKYNTIPKVEWNREKAEWIPDHEIKLRKGNNRQTQAVVRDILEGKITSGEKDPLRMLA